MQMDAGLDTGPMLLARTIAIGAHETGGSLHDRLAELGARMIVEALDRISEGSVIATPQPDEGVTYAARLQRTDEWLDWTLSAEALANRIRAFDPEPGTRTALVDRSDAQVKVWSARALPLSCDARPGTVLEASRSAIRVACGVGALDLLEVQRPGGRRQAVRDWLQSSAIGPGDRLGNPSESPLAGEHGR
jgi:methionyl-tRNA formyltransferase